MAAHGVCGEAGSVNVPVYRTEGNGRRVRRSFTNPEDAKDDAWLMARKIMAGQSQGKDLAAPEREACLAAKNLLDGMGCPLVAAAEEYAECKRLPGSRSLLAAVTEHVERTRGVQTEVTVPAAAAEFLEAKKQDGPSTLFLALLPLSQRGQDV